MSQDSPDIRKQVEASRGPQKKLELLVPGLRGYRKLEDLRVSDEMLRNQVADKLDQARANLEVVRKQMASAGDYTNLTSIGSLISQAQQLGGEVRHAQQGYSGFVAAISMDEEKLNKLYDFDYQFVSSAIQVVSLTSPPSFRYDPAAPGSAQAGLSAVSGALAETKQKWAVRMEAISSVLVK